ncbi:glutathione synthase [Lapidilactobacillus mulanensis]|uniref:Glutamate--cysteine ligase n=1 Tax=Lapidilactobacillus mulanensis TaxID=2485999 RepID=A0ABW4DP29_9LACO|nr:glutathione synthase [Lapidilactobacillus mulanensis]
MDDYGKSILNLGVGDFSRNFTWGLEVERHRINSDGFVSEALYPAALGEQSANPYLKNDFFNTQSEMITPVAGSIDSVLHTANALDHTLRASLATDELLWPFSMPPKLTADHSELVYANESPKKVAYFEEIGRRFGKLDGAPSGIHVNLGPTTAWTNAIAQRMHRKQRQVRDDLLLKQAVGFMHYRWLLTYLKGASPIAEVNYLSEVPDQAVRSLRNSREFGYGYAQHFKGDYSSVEGYVTRIKEAIASGELLAESAYHEPVRLRHMSGLDAMVAEGVSHIELRMLDLDPMSAIGIERDTLLLIQLMSLFFMVSPSLDPNSLTAASFKNDQVSLEHPYRICCEKPEALKLMNRLQQLIRDADLPEEYTRMVRRTIEQIRRPNLTTSGQLLPRVRQGSLCNYGLQLAEEFQLLSQLNPSPVYRGFASNSCPPHGQLQRELFDQYSELPRVNLRTLVVNDQEKPEAQSKSM